MYLNMQDVNKYEILSLVLHKKIKGYEAAQILGYTQVHISRLKKKVKKLGLSAFVRHKRKPHNIMPVKTRDRILSLHRELYWDFNIMHFRDKLTEEHNIKYSYEALRKILIKDNQHRPKKRKKVYRRRRRMPCAGMLLQMDSSQHNWIPEVPEKWWLTACIDDATNEVPFAMLYPSDGVFNNMDVLRKTVEKKGVFAALYVDKASQFKTVRHGGLHVNVSEEQDDTQVERALGELGINLIPANSCQAKGRIERLFRIFQDRFIRELRLRGIKDYALANKFLIEEFLPYYNRKFSHTQGIQSLYRELPKDINLNFVFCKKSQRCANADNTVQFAGEVIQIPPSKYRISFAKCRVDACLLESGKVHVLYENQLIHTFQLPENNKYATIDKKTEKFLNKREYANLTF